MGHEVGKQGAEPRVRPLVPHLSAIDPGQVERLLDRADDPSHERGRHRSIRVAVEVVGLPIEAVLERA